MIIDYKQKYFELKTKYLDILKKNNELEKSLNNNNIHSNINNNINNNFKSIYHSHILYDDTNNITNWKCDICESSYKAKTEKRFRCQNCDFDICIKCKILEESGYKFNNVFLSIKHNHLLKKKNSKSSLFSRYWFCDVCNKQGKNNEKRFRCDLCDYDICDDCKNNEENNINQLNAELNNMHIDN